MLDKMALSNFRDMHDNYAILVLARGENLQEANLDIVNELTGGNKPCLYVTVNQPYRRMVQLLKKRGMDPGKFFFIDCITKMSGGRKEEAENVLYIDSPGNLTELSIAISQALKAMKGDKILFVDALSTLMIYNKPNAFSKFAHYAMTNVKSNSVLGIFMIVEGEVEEEVFSQVDQFSDEIIDLR
jgi:KaiC/GvpD/RAD55 family RecA-like ATPase